ncbi:alpha-L-rhamnosidase [Bombilactobacillus thymidiniphilus]|uniref:alpha-L-rhamnosidase n=1 Tax=Bombilactobacillus thymidiniphilus TaxID=2923363 RepID=A0ABY4PCA9_9LACO|nr:alpha-L-rhamnosidase [Bombilactobacillus thymidiniphilus]UQS83398.1 glycoside hydrolase family 78 protein [Bombilactobacillus thymidiniphilus]
MKIMHILVNHMSEPLGFELKNLRIEFQVQQDHANNIKLQKKIQIYLDSPNSLEYQTDWQDFPNNYFNVDLDLQPRTRYQVVISIRSVNQEIQAQTWFETGKMSEPFSAHWIGNADIDSANIILQRELAINKPLKKARLYISGLGLYETYIDGQKVGQEYLTPGVSAYDQFVQVQTYDITRQLVTMRTHKLCIGCGDGWYKGNFGFDGGQDCIYGNRQQAIAEYHLDFTDGSHQVIITDQNWQTTTGPIKKAAIYYGEDYDATDLLKDWQPVELIEQSKTVLRDRLSLPITVNQRLVPKLIQTPSGEQILDFGQNQAGWIEFYNREPSGIKLSFEMGEILQNGEFYRDNLREARATFTYVSNGKSEWVRPHFTYFGYRYVKVSGNTLPLNAEDYQAAVLCSQMEDTGSITTNSSLVNRLFKNVIWGQRSNFLDIPTDCPQRDERLGWTGDANIFSQTAAYNMNVFAFFKKYAHDIALEQQQNDGFVPMYAPAMGQKDGGAAVWADAATMIPWNMYQIYGDPAILRQNYSQMKAWVDWISQHTTTPNLWTGTFQFGDWLALDGENPGKPTGKTDEDFIASIYYYCSTNIVAQTAQLLKDPANYRRYLAQARNIKKAIQQEYITANGRLAIDSQTAYSLALCFDIVTQEQKEHVVADLVRRINLDKQHLTTGFVGTPYLCQALSDNGQHKLATTIFLNEDFPSWLYAVKLGATTVWERWDSVQADGTINSQGMNSLNHYSIGAIMAWAYKYLLGIKAQTPGFQKTTFSPQFDYRLPRVEGSFQTSYGKIAVQSAIETDEQHTILIKLVVPIGVDLQVFLPRSQQQIISVNQQEKIGDGFWLSSGEYQISYQPTLDYIERYTPQTPVKQILVDQDLVAQIMDIDPVLNFFVQDPQAIDNFGSMSLTEMNTTFPFINISEQHLQQINDLLTQTEILSERK